jgi:hypothetical protein
MSDSRQELCRGALERNIGRFIRYCPAAISVTGGDARVGDRQSAEALAKVLRERLARADLHLPTGDDQTLRTYATNWLKTARLNLKASTVSFYDGHLDQHILPALGPRPVRTLRRSDCRELVTMWRGKGLHASTVRGIARTLSTILSQAVETSSCRRTGAAARAVPAHGR